MGTFWFAGLCVLLLFVNESGGKIANKAFTINEDESKQVLYNKFLEDEEPGLSRLSSELEGITREGALLQELSHAAESLEEDLMMEPVLDIEIMVAAIGEQREKKMREVASPGVVGPILREGEKERGLRAKDVGPQPLKDWLDSLVGEARRVVWRVGPRMLKK